MPYFLYDIQFHSVIANYTRISFKSNFFIFSFHLLFLSNNSRFIVISTVICVFMKKFTSTTSLWSFLKSNGKIIHKIYECALATKTIITIIITTVNTTIAACFTRTTFEIFVKSTTMPTVIIRTSPSIILKEPISIGLTSCIIPITTFVTFRTSTSSTS